jgi:hypothetical protein
VARRQNALRTKIKDLRLSIIRPFAIDQCGTYIVAALEQIDNVPEFAKIPNSGTSSGVLGR